MGQGRDKNLKGGDGIQGQAAVRILDDGDRLCGIRRSLRDDLPELGQMATQGVDGLRALPDQKLSDQKDHRCSLGLFALHGHEAHGRALCCFADRLCIGGIILLALDEGLDVGGRDEPHLVAQLADLTAPEMRAATGFHRHDTRLQLAEEGQHLIPPQRLAQLRPTRGISPMDLKHILRQVEPDRSNLRHDRSPLWILTDPPWHIDAVGGRSHHQSHFAR